MKLTPWFPGRTKPIRAGVYQQLCGKRSRVGYQRWDGTFWYSWHFTPEAAARSTVLARTEHQNDPWRGIAQDSWS